MQVIEQIDGSGGMRLKLANGAVVTVLEHGFGEGLLFLQPKRNDLGWSVAAHMVRLPHGELDGGEAWGVGSRDLERAGYLGEIK